MIHNILIFMIGVITGKILYTQIDAISPRFLLEHLAILAMLAMSVFANFRGNGGAE